MKQAIASGEQKISKKSERRVFTSPFTPLKTPVKRRAENDRVISPIYDSSRAATNADPAPSPCCEAGVGVVRSSNRSESTKRANHASEGARTDGIGTVLSGRDRSIFRLCLEQTFLLKEHLDRFFPGTSDRRPYQRLRVLENAGFITREFYPELGQKMVLRLTRRGEAVAAASATRLIKTKKHLDPKLLVHDALVTSCRLRLLDFWEAEFVPERAIKTKDFPEIPDGIFFFPSGSGIALEVENSDKGRSRFLRLLERWTETSSIVFVLYVASTERLFACIKRHLKEAPDDQPCGVVLWKDLAVGKPVICTSQGELDLLGKKRI